VRVWDCSWHYTGKPQILGNPTVLTRIRIKLTLKCPATAVNTEDQDYPDHSFAWDADQANQAGQAMLRWERPKQITPAHELWIHRKWLNILINSGEYA
jgi:hypothetical protein